MPGWAAISGIRNLAGHSDTDAPVAQIAAVVDAAKPLGIDKEWPAKFLIPLMRCV